MRRVLQTILAEWSLPYSFTIHSAEERTFDVKIDVLEYPVTIAMKVWLETGLDVATA